VTHDVRKSYRFPSASLHEGLVRIHHGDCCHRSPDENTNSLTIEACHLTEKLHGSARIALANTGEAGEDQPSDCVRGSDSESKRQESPLSLRVSLQS
jgi:hypothetical protein